jgi:hypothetical protein
VQFRTSATFQESDRPSATGLGTHLNRPQNAPVADVHCLSCETQQLRLFTEGNRAGAMNLGRNSPWRARNRTSLLFCTSLLLLTPGAASSQRTDTSAGTPADVVLRLQALEKRLTESEDALKARTSELAEAITRIQALESRAGGETTPENSGPTPQIAPPATSRIAGAPDHDAMEIASTPKMSIRGFGDVRFGKEPYATSPASFAFGQLDLYITSRLSDRTSVLMETVFESGTDNALGVDVERILLQQRISRYLKLEGGRNHTAIGYYNTTFHHGTWFQMATGRPFLFSFEDEGGLLPVHSIGVRASGEIPSGSLGLQYTLEVGNGRSYDSGVEPVHNRIDGSAAKAVNVALSAAPDRFPGLHIGVSAFRETLKDGGLVPIRQQIFAGYLVYDRGRLQLLNEAVWMRHTQAGRTTSIPGGYTQLAYRFEPWSPYLRFEYLRAAKSDPIARLVLPGPGVRRQASAGIRYDFTAFAALKLEYGRLIQETLAAANLAALQVAFTF